MKHNLILKTFGIIIFLCITTISNSQNIYAFAGDGTPGYAGDGGPAINCEFNQPSNLAIDASGNIYISDFTNNRIRKINTSGIITTAVGTGSPGFSGDGGLAINAQLWGPSFVAVDASGNLYISDVNNGRIRKVNTAGIISTVVGDGASTYGGDGGPATSAQINGPIGITFDAAGNMYFADQDNQRVRKVTTAGIISTVAGTGANSYGGDGGPAVNAKLNFPLSVAIDASGNLFISDFSNKLIRKVNTSGIISTIVGTPEVGAYSGDGGLAVNAQIGGLYNMAFDAAGNLIFGDPYNNRIRQITPTGSISTIFGTGVIGNSGDGGPAANALISHPFDIIVDSHGNYYILDEGNYRIREICVANCLANINSVSENDNGVMIFPNPNNGSFKVEIKSEIKNCKLILLNILGQKVYEQKIFLGINDINSNSLSKGLYQYTILQDGQKISKGKLVAE